MFNFLASIIASSILVIAGMWMHIGAFNDLVVSVKGMEEQRFGLSTFDESQGGTGTSTVSSNYLNDCLSVIDDSPLTYSWADCAASGSGDPFPFVVSNPNGQAGVSTSTLVRFLAGATTSILTSNSALFGATATSSFSSAGALTLATALTVANGGTGASTLTGCLTGNGTGAITGSGTCATFAFPWTVSTPNAQTGNSTTTLLRFLGGASTTVMTANSAKFGQTATATISTAGAVTIPSGLTVADLTSAIVLTGSGGLFAEYTGIDCTNQFVRDVSALGAGTCATVGASDVSLANLTATDASITFSGTYNGSTARTIGVNLGHAFVWTSTHDFGGATSVEMVNGSSPTVDAIGEFALDTTENELIFATSTTATSPAVIKPYEWKGFAHGSSTQGSGTTTKAFFIAPPVGTGYLDSVTCHSNSFLRVLLKDEAGNRMNDLIASSTEGVVKLVSNNGFTASEVILADIGTTTNIAANAYVTCYAKIIYIRN